MPYNSVSSKDYWRKQLVTCSKMCLVSSRFITFISSMRGYHYAVRALLARLYHPYVPPSQMAAIIQMK